MKIESTVEKLEPVRHITIEVPESRARVVSKYLYDHASWVHTPCYAELVALHEAFGGHVA